MSKSNPNAKAKKAVALRYNEEESNAPVIIASGYGEIAEKIIDLAEQKGIPVFRDDSAASLLCMLEIGSNIPPELYQVIAAIYVQILRTTMELKNPGSGAALSPAMFAAPPPAPPPLPVREEEAEINIEGAASDYEQHD